MVEAEKSPCVSLCLTSRVVARRQRLAALTGGLVGQPLGVGAVGGLVRLFVLDEDFAHQLLGAGQRDARLQLRTERVWLLREVTWR